MKWKIIPLTEEQIAQCPFPDTARKLGGILVVEDEELTNHLNVEKFWELWNNQITQATQTFRTPIIPEDEL